jgi:hypothetical protein
MTTLCHIFVNAKFNIKKAQLFLGTNWYLLLILQEILVGQTFGRKIFGRSIRSWHLDGFVEDRVKEEVALDVPVGQVDGQADRAAGEGVGGNEGVGDGGFLLGSNHQQYYRKKNSWIPEF